MVQEIWKPTPRYEGVYEASSFGRVRRVAPGQGTRPGYVLKPIVGRRGYLAVNVYSEARKRKREYVHRLVAEAFHGLSDLPLVRHLDDDPSNNVPANLRHGTPAENYADAVANKGSWDTRNKLATHCPNGHEYTEMNTKVVNSGQGKSTRKCRECLRLAARRRYWRKKALSAA